MRNISDHYRYDTAAFQQVAQAAQDQVGIHFDEAARKTETDSMREIRRMFGQDVSGQLDMEIREGNLPTGIELGTIGLHQNKGMNSPYDLRGLLRAEEGYIDVHIDPEAAGFGYPWGIDKRVEVSVLSSATGINDVQEMLGRTPGTDAVKLTTSPGRVVATPGEWLEGFGDSLEIGISDTSDWDMAEHDRAPYDHVQSWIATPAQILMKAAARAREIKDMYGKKIHLPAPDRPKEVDEFAHGLDCLSSYTREPMAKMLELGNEQLQKPPLHYVYNWVNAHPRRYAWVFQKIGVIAAGRDGDEVAKTMQGINQLYVQHLAKVCLRLDEIRPDEEISQETQAARTKMLQQAIEKYDLAA
jgi:hypothetical protein